MNNGKNEEQKAQKQKEANPAQVVKTNKHE